MIKWIVIGMLGIGLFITYRVLKRIAVMVINGFEEEVEDE